MSDAWNKGQPNGGKGENCVVITDLGFYDYSCDRQHCGICDMPMAPLFQMRGLCQKSNFEHLQSDFTKSAKNWQQLYKNSFSKKYLENEA